VNQPPPATPTSATVMLDAADAIEIAEALQWLRDWFASDHDVLARSMRRASFGMFNLDELDGHLDHYSYQLGYRP
jgi:hypothetical protein